jgi:NAD(P)-dependent dehydrogenase (short-subunit alcohol dehydrogenase family)
VVTGGSRGIGAAVARVLAELGARVTLIARDAERLERVRAALPGSGPHAAVAADVTDADAVAQTMHRARELNGAAFVLVNCAGGADSAAFVDTDDRTWRRLLDVNLMGAVFCTRALLPDMVAAGEGRVVNIASTAGLTGYRYVSAYVASKHALVGLTRALALETARSGITINAVCPGYTNTELLSESAARAARKTGKAASAILDAYAAANPQGRLIEPDDVARAVAWLCHPEQRSVTGQTLVVDGGSLL